MIDANQKETPAATLCKNCGLCCTGHLFVWTKLRSAELDSIQSLGLKVLREPHQRGFNQPCPLWDQVCTIYDTPDYPRFCGTYKCKLLKQLLDENIPLPSALTVVQRTMDMIQEIETFLPTSPEISFRERLVAQMEQEKSNSDFQRKAKALLSLFDEQFGVNDFLSPLVE